jgi:hypothetical protein
MSDELVDSIVKSVCGWLEERNFHLEEPEKTELAITILADVRAQKTQIINWPEATSTTASSWPGFIPTVQLSPFDSPVKLSEAEKEAARKQFTEGKACPHCGGLHMIACQRVKRLVMRRADEPSEVEFFKNPAWPEDSVVWPHEVYDGETPQADGTPGGQPKAGEA